MCIHVWEKWGRVLVEREWVVLFLGWQMTKLEEPFTHIPRGWKTKGREKKKKLHLRKATRSQSESLDVNMYLVKNKSLSLKAPILNRFMKTQGTGCRSWNALPTYCRKWSSPQSECPNGDLLAERTKPSRPFVVSLQRSFIATVPKQAIKPSYEWASFQARRRLQDRLRTLQALFLCELTYLSSQRQAWLRRVTHSRLDCSKHSSGDHTPIG